MSRRDRISARRVLREAVANQVARPVLSVAILLVLAALTIVVGLTETDSAIGVRNYSAALAADGYDTIIVTSGASSTGMVAPYECVALDGVPGVRAALWESSSANYSLFDPAGPAVSLTRVGGDVRAWLSSVDPPAARAWRGQPLIVDAASVLADRRPTLTARLAAGSATTDYRAVTADLRSLGSGFRGNAMLVSAPPREAQSCELLVEEQARASVYAAAGRAFPIGNGYALQWVLANPADFQPPVARYDARPSQYGWLVATCVALILFCFFLRIARGELALYSASGLSARMLAFYVGTEFVLFLVVAAIVGGVPTVLALAHGGAAGADFRLGVDADARFLTATVLGAVAIAGGVAVTASGAALDALRDR